MSGLSSSSLPPFSGEVAKARGAVYLFLSRLFLREPGKEALALLRANPEILTLPLPPEAGNEEEWLHNLRVQFSRLFLLNVYPYESIYTGPEVMLNSHETEVVEKFYQPAGFIPANPAEKTLFKDHLGLELSFMAYLARQEAEAWSQQNGPGAFNCQQVSRRFLREHLLPWLPLFSLALEDLGSNQFYPVLARSTLQFCAEDLISLELTGLEWGLEIRNFREKDDKLELEAEKDELAGSSLGEIANWLSVPLKSGVFLSRGVLFSLAAELNLPAGGEDRFQMIKYLLEAAGQFEVFTRLLELLKAKINSYRAELADLQGEFSEIASLWTPWGQRLVRTADLLQEMLNRAKFAQLK